MAHDVFISYSTKDKVTADAICAVLESHGIRCWVAPRDVIPGRNWGESIVAAIKGARVMVLILSGHANESLQIKLEVERAVSKGVPVLPVRIEDVVPSSALELFISSSHWLDAFVPPLEEHLRHLAGVIDQLLATPPHQPVSDPQASKGAETRAAQKINEEAKIQWAKNEAEEVETARKQAMPPPPPPPNFPPRKAPEENLPRRSSRPASEDGPHPGRSHKVLWTAAAVAIFLIALGVSYKIHRDREEPEGRFHQVESKLRGLLQ